MANPFAQFAPTDSTTETKSTEPNQFAKFASKASSEGENQFSKFAKDKKEEFQGNTESGRVTQILDGDTVEIEGSDGFKFRVRLKGIDAPETSHETSAIKIGRAHV